jgi:T-complex protein 1 subunit delta
LYNAACTSLESKVVSSHCHILAPIAVKSILSILDRKHSFNVDLKRIKIIKKMGGTVEQTELINGIAIDYPVIKSYGGPNKMINARVALIQFSISSPSTDTENSLVIENYTQMDKLLKEEKQFIISLCRKIKSTSCNVILIQK